MKLLYTHNYFESSLEVLEKWISDSLDNILHIF